MPSPQTPIPENFALDCDGYRSLLAAVEKDTQKDPGFHDYTGRLIWAVNRARHYAEKTGLTPESILDSWEKSRDYWYMNYYQDAKQPTITSDKVRIFDTVFELLASIGKTGFRCPACAGISKSPYECDSGVKVEGKPCDWKVYGLFRDLGKGITVFVKSEIRADLIFMPIAWETAAESPITPLPA